MSMTILTIITQFSYLIISLEAFDEGLHVGDFVVKTDRIWVDRISISKGRITVKERKKKIVIINIKKKKVLFIALPAIKFELRNTKWQTIFPQTKIKPGKNT